MKFNKISKKKSETEKSPKKGIGTAKRSSGKVAWGIDIGENSIKAAKVSFRDGKINVLVADIIDYTKPDQSTAPDKSKMVEEAVSTFIKRNPIDASDKIIISISGRMVLSRFISLPPMKKSRITEAIKFELRKQIPFDPSEIVWDSYRFENITKSKKGFEVGIFATKKENIYSILPSLATIRMNIEAIQTTPVAIYNLVRMLYAIEEDVIVINVEKGDTDFIVAGKAKFWNRSISISEVNMDFVREIQRSMGYYVSLTKDAMPENIFLIGEMFEDEEKVKFVTQNLEGKVTCLNLSEKTKISKDVDPLKLNERSISGFGTVFGLALQGLNLAKININFLPFDYIRERLIPKRKKLVNAIAVMVFLCLLTQGIKDFMAWKTHSKCESTITLTLKEAGDTERDYKKVSKNVEKEEERLSSIESIGAQGRFWMEVIHKIIDIMPKDVYLSSMESRWDAPYAEGNKKGKNPKEVKKVLIMSVKGESYDPSMAYIEEMIKKPLEEIRLFGQESPAFRNVEIVSTYHVSQSKEESESASVDIDRSGQLIAFEVRWMVNTTNLRGAYANRMKKEFALNE